MDHILIESFSLIGTFMQDYIILNACVKFSN